MDCKRSFFNLADGRLRLIMDGFEFRHDELSERITHVLAFVRANQNLRIVGVVRFTGNAD